VVVDLLLAHRSLLERRRQVMNLVGPGPLDPHYQDCEQALSILKPSGRWADLGTGAGFPGIIFAAKFPNVTIDLVDSRSKRCTFLEAVLLEAGRPPHVRVLCQRLEDLPSAAYDGLTARALSAPREMLNHARRLLRPQGQLLLFLQDEEVPPIPDFQKLQVHRYAFEGGHRRSALLQYTPA